MRGGAVAASCGLRHGLGSIHIIFLQAMQGLDAGRHMRMIYTHNIHTDCPTLVFLFVLRSFFCSVLLHCTQARQRQVSRMCSGHSCTAVINRDYRVQLISLHTTQHVL